MNGLANENVQLMCLDSDARDPTNDALPGALPDQRQFFRVQREIFRGWVTSLPICQQIPRTMSENDAKAGIRHGDGITAPCPAVQCAEAVASRRSRTGLAGPQCMGP